LRGRLVRLVAVCLSLWAATFFCTPARAACPDSVAQARREQNSDGTVVVPYFFGLARDRAQAAANDACVTVRFVGPSTSSAKVVVQSVPAGRSVRVRSMVVLRLAMVDSATVPSLIGLSQEAATAKATASGLKPLFYGPSIYHGAVASQSRPAGQTVARGSFIQLQMGASRALTVPDFVGRTRSQAAALAAANHLDAAFSGADDDNAHVVSQSPSPGAQVPAGTTEQLQLAAAARLTAPNLLHRTRAAAKALAARRGLVLGMSGDQSPDARVARQSPGPGTNLDPGARIQVTMAIPAIVEPSPGASAAATESSEAVPIGTPTPTPTGVGNAATTQVPDLTGMLRSEVQGHLAAHGLSPDFLGDASADARVTSQSPSAGENVSPHAIVNVVMAKPAGSLVPWIAGIGGAIVVAVGGFLAFRPRRKKGIVSMVPQAATTPPPTPPVTPPAPPPPLATFTATADQGRPTVRLASEPAAAARGLLLQTQQGRQP
jgi:beta-lactam-binding protein with PASTA domain